MTTPTTTQIEIEFNEFSETEIENSNTQTNDGNNNNNNNYQDVIMQVVDSHEDEVDADITAAAAVAPNQQNASYSCAKIMIGMANMAGVAIGGIIANVVASNDNASISDNSLTNTLSTTAIGVFAMPTITLFGWLGHRLYKAWDLANNQAPVNNNNAATPAAPISNNVPRV